jgi:thioredoxin-dependent peroxiredoxin
MTVRTFALAVATAFIGWLAHADDVATPAREPAAAVNVGEALPAFEAVDDQGRNWMSKEHTGKNVLVMYFYPGDFTGGCMKQAQAFRDGLARLEELGVELVGVSGDEVATHQLFKASHGLKHTLVSDPDGKLAERLGIPVKRPVKPAKVRTSDLEGKPLMDGQGKSVFVERKVTLPRWTLIVGRDGTLISKRMNVDPAKDADEVITIVENLSK